MPVSRGWAFRAQSSVASGTTSLTITKPTGTLDDDIMVMFLVHKGAGYATMPSGWTSINQNISGSTRAEVHWKRAASEGANYSITGLADTAEGFIISYEGGLLSGSPVGTVVSRANASGTVGHGDFTCAEDNALILIFEAIGSTFIPSTFVNFADR